MEGEWFDYDIQVYNSELNTLETHHFTVPKFLYQHLITLNYTNLEYEELLEEAEEIAARYSALTRSDATFKQKFN